MAKSVYIVPTTGNTAKPELIPLSDISRPGKLVRFLISKATMLCYRKAPNGTFSSLRFLPIGTQRNAHMCRIPMV